MDWCFFQKPICRIRVSLMRVAMERNEGKGARGYLNSRRLHSTAEEALPV
jgi:hypothetical protein